MIKIKSPNTFLRYAVISAQAVTELFNAWVIKTRKDMNNIWINPESVRRQFKHRDMVFLIKCTDLLVKIGTIRTGRKCFFRAYILGSVLRKWDVPIVMNVGLRNLNAGTNAQGHCWLTLKGELVAENRDPSQAYPWAMGVGLNGIRYWLGPKTTARISQILNI